ncbi:uncharacterized protein LOC122001450 [Zingiber officinale]|uniref:Uncharacterized protein n=1 Tax=Zingiber officinale TaxID=94328 RepID=A0A8J5FR52_ZINOF|nr:uncharacterized protein LOC122001450 [Zingiber officinale]KAG6492674.1 hypothetical protein ZIOFF_047639 [Zingiber officinale]
MASLTPGVLLKLLQSMNTDARIAGEHRSALLQVTGIVPALSASTADDLWPSHGFYLQLSDSANSTYVTLSDVEADAILSSRPQIGQLVHVDRLQFAHPVPRAVGLRPVPGARVHLIVGSPEPLVARSSPDQRSFVIQPASAAEAGPPLVSSSSFRSNSLLHDKDRRTIFAARENVIKNHVDSAGKPRRFTSPASAKLSSRKVSLGDVNSSGDLARDPSPASKTTSRASSPAVQVRSGARASSPVPSKCEVPSLVAAKDENRRIAREPAIIVPSRYRQPSPIARKASGSPMGRRASISPARRLSGGFKMTSPAAGEAGGKKKTGLVVGGFAKVSDAASGSLKSIRKSWDDSLPNVVGVSESKDKGGSKSKADKQSILTTQVAVSQRRSNVGRMQTNDENTTFSEKRRTNNRVYSSCESDKSNMIPKITVHDRKWTDGSILFDSVSENLARLGKEAFQRRNIAAVAAAEAIEEALATESVIRILSMFSDLCSSSNASNPVPMIDRFLPLYNDVLRWTAVAESLYANRNSEGQRDAVPTEHSSLATLWVEAALATDIQVLHLVSEEAENLSKRKASERLTIPQLDSSKTFLLKRQSVGVPSRNNHLKCLLTPSTNTWSRGHELSETLELAKTLKREMQLWFLKSVEEAMDVGFRLFGEKIDMDEEVNRKEKVTAVLSQLKRINDWLDAVVRTPEIDTLKEKIEQLKRKIYGFVITHVGTAFDNSVILS